MLAVAGCSSARSRVPQNAPVIAGSLQSPQTASPEVQLARAQARVLELEQRLVKREREIAAVRAEIAAAQAREEATRARLDEILGATADGPGGPQEPSRAGRVPGTHSTGAGTGSPQLLATLRDRLVAERERRVQLEHELARLREETSAGPFENKQQVELQKAQKEIAQLRESLATERRAREKIQRDYEALQAQLQKSAPASSESEEIAALKERQQRVLAAIKRDLAASQQREQELREVLAATQGADAVPLAEAITNLRAENAAFQARLEEEHRRNRELSAKLATAMRVTDLIFRMQRETPPPAAPAALGP